MLMKLCLIIVEKKHASHALAATEEMQTETQKDQSIVNEINKQQVLVQYLKVRNVLQVLLCTFQIFLSFF